MTIVFTEEEQQYIDKKPFNWTLKANTPKHLAKDIELKLQALNRDAGGTKANSAINDSFDKTMFRAVLTHEIKRGKMG